MLVWKARPSINVVMSPMREELLLIFCMDATTRLTTSPPSCAAPDAVRASSLAFWADEAVWLTADAISSMELAVCCSPDAACSVRPDRSRLPTLSSSLAVDTPCAACCTSCSASFSAPRIRSSERSSWPVSSLA